MVVEVGGEQLLLGVSAAGVHALHTLAAPLPEPAPAPRFADLLAQARGRGRGAPVGAPAHAQEP